MIARPVAATVRRLAVLPLLAAVVAPPAFADTTADERELRRLHASLDAALVAGDADVFDRVFGPDYFFSHHFGYKVDRADNLAFLRSLRTAPTYEVLEATSDDVAVRVYGDAAVVTAAWRTVGRGLDDPGALPHTDTGRYTGVYERHADGWKLATEHLSEAMHDPETMAAEVRTAGRAYVALLQRLHDGRDHAALAAGGDLAELERTLDDGFTYTDPAGRVHTRADELAAYRDPEATIDRAEILRQDVRPLGNTAALEQITVRFEGTRRGEPYVVTKQTSNVWFWKGFRWRLAADHSGRVEEIAGR